MNIKSLVLINSTLITFNPIISFGKESINSNDNIPPNVIIVITDDQGYGDLSCHGNKIIKTPNLDKFYEDAVRLTNFHVSPTSAPTRGALMTGRYSNRINTFHTIAGRSQLFEDEKTLAEVFAENGYSNGLFGKWHLGDNYPFIPEDRGFNEVVRHGGGGITQGPDYWGNDYFDDTYWHNGKTQKYKGYCTDVFFDEALEFIENNKNRPFFCYISTNAPHSPFHVPEKYYKIYENEDELLDNQKRFYGMITNIDDNFQRLQNKLAQLKIDDNTILIFMTDNGTSSGVANKNGEQYGFDGGLRGNKGSEYDGGHRVPFFIKWKEGNIQGGHDINNLTAHVDVLPTLVELCNLQFTESKPLDGKSLLPLLKKKDQNWEKRVLIVDSQRGQSLVKWHKSAVMSDTWRLINGKELYNIELDKKQTKDVASKYPEVVEDLRTEYNNWWTSLLKEGVNERYSYIKVGTSFENPVMISSHDMHTGFLGNAWHQYGALEAQQAHGNYKVEFMEEGKYRVSLCRYPKSSGLTFNQKVEAIGKSIEVSDPMPASKDVNMISASLYVANIAQTKPIFENTQEVVFEIEIPNGKYDLEAILTDDENRVYPSYYIYIEKI